MANVGNVKNVIISDNKGQVGTDNEIDIKGGLGKDSSVGNTSDIVVFGTNDGKMGAENKCKITGGVGEHATIGNTSGVTVGSNSGSIGCGNKFNIS